MTRYRGIVRGGVVQFDGPAGDLKEGTEVTVSPIKHPKANGPAICEAVMSGPPIPKDVMDEFNAILEEAWPIGKHEKAFDHLKDQSQP